jgi:signal transduction histidine kinase
LQFCCKTVSHWFQEARVAFAVFVFLMASSVLLAGAPLRYAWFVAQSDGSYASLLPVSLVWIAVAVEILFALSFMLAGLWFLRHAKGRMFYYLLAVTLIALGPSSSDFSQQLIYAKPDGAEHFWFWPVYGLRTLGLIGLGLTLLLFPSGRFVTAWSCRVGWGWVTWCVVLFLIPNMPLNFIYGSDRPKGLGLALPMDLSIGSFGVVTKMPWPYDGLHTTELLAKLEPTLQLALVFVSMALFGGAQAQRYRRFATGLERQQLRWGWLGIFLLHVGMVLYFGYGAISRLLQFNSGGGSIIYTVLTGLATVFSSGLPICYSIALLRPAVFEWRLFSRSSLVYVTLTGISLGVFASLVSGFGSFFGGAGVLPLGILSAAVSLLAVVLLRDSVQFLANRFVVTNDDSFRVLQSLRLNLEATRDPAQILPDAAATVASALRLPFVRIVAFEPDSSLAASDFGMSRLQTLAEIGQSGLELRQYPFVSNGAPVGFLEITPRGADDPLTRAELRLLETVVGQLGTSTKTFMLGEELRRANAQLLEARELERQRLRDELHDGVLGALSGMKMKLGVLEMQQAVNSQSSFQSGELLSGIMRDLEHTQSDVRRLVNGLHASALETLGLHGALEQFVGSHGGLRIELRTSGITPGITSPSHMPLEVQAVALRIAQEAITNVIKHAQAKTCVVSIRLEASGLHLEIEDDGVGLPALLPAGQGLRSMRERAARIGGLLEVGSAVHGAGGTRVWTRLPLAAMGNA